MRADDFIPSFHSWLKIHPEYKYEVEPDKDSPNWLFSVTNSEESFVISFQDDSIESYLFIGLAKFPSHRKGCSETDDALLSKLLRICNKINGQYLGGKCEINEEYGIEVLFHASIAVRLFLSLSDEEKNLYLVNAFEVIQKMIGSFKADYPDID